LGWLAFEEISSKSLILALPWMAGLEEEATKIT
jgi:hypothetical protein